MINLNDIIEVIKDNIGLQYLSNDEIATLGRDDQIINFIHPLLTPESIASLAELRIPNDKGDYKATTIYNTGEIIKYNNIYYISLSDNNDETPNTAHWSIYDPVAENIEKEFNNKLKVIISDIYASIKNKGQTVDVFHDGEIFKKGKFNLKNEPQIIKLIPKYGKLLINTLNLKSKEFTIVNIDIYDLEDFGNVFSDSVEVDINEIVEIAKESNAGFVIKIEPDNDILFWEFNSISEHLKAATRSNEDLTDIINFNNDYYSNINEFACLINAKIYCDLTEFFINNIDILLPYIIRKLAHSYLKTIYFNGGARSNKYTANEKRDNAETDIFGDKMNVGSLIKEINDLEKNLISKFGYGNPCLKARKSKVSYESI